MPAPFLVQTDTFHNQVPDISVNYVGQPHIHAHTDGIVRHPTVLLCNTDTCKSCSGWIWLYNQTYISACCLFEGKLWATDGYLINKFPPDRSVFMLRASHSTSVLQSLMCFSQLSCFPLMRPKMTCGLSGKMVSAQDDELPFYFKLSVGSIANRSIKHQTFGNISSFFIFFKIWVLFFMTLWSTSALADLAA